MINKIELLNNIGLSADSDTVQKLVLWQNAFKDYNSHTNLMSRGDIEVLFEKHVFDSLAINLKIIKISLMSEREADSQALYLQSFSLIKK